MALNDIVKNQVVSFFRSAVKTQRKREKVNEIYIWLMYKSEKEIFCYLQAGEKETEERELDSLLNTLDMFKVKGLELSGAFNLNEKTSEILLDIAKKKSIEKENLRVCIYEDNRKVLTTIYDGEKELSCSLLEDEI